MENRFMRTILFFDLPSVTKKDHREYTKFIKKLKKKGFAMLSINETVVDATIRDLKESLPPEGVISCLTVTEKQFASIDVLLGEMTSDVIMSESKVIKL